MTEHNFGKICNDCGNRHMVNGNDTCEVTGKRLTQTRWTVIYEVGCASFVPEHPSTKGGAR
jgi:hypothetical protein